MSTVKAVLLCTRPEDHVTKPPPKHVSHKPFVTTVKAKTAVSKKTDASKSTAAIHRNAKKMAEARKPTATDKHKEWLANLARVKQQALDEAELFRQMKQEEKEKFMERSSMLRTLLRKNQWKESHVQAPKVPSEEKKKLERALSSSTKKIKKICTEASQSGQPIESKNGDRTSESKTVHDTKSSSSKNLAKLANRPKWSMTKDQIDKNEKDEEDSLLNFAMGLDFEKFMDDLDVRDAMEFVQKRVEELEGKTDEITSEERMHADAVKDATRAERIAEIAIDRAEAEAKVAGGSTTLPEDPIDVMKAEEAARAAESKMAMRQKSIRQVHSKASIQNVIHKEKEKYAKKRLIVEQRWTDAPVEEPKSRINKMDFSGAAASKKAPRRKPTIEDQNKVQKLPYMYRHPAI
eukprot:CAMPEP_0184492016 /NCGR_PEP_ID=MMETSP0113_2-20130426/22048_1 /TAXON_ID=91329 /ORGANISM="Norrisiella sphaerica, Strain BC52" /LENGTH=405 /DNA_ID=CAMNT_0026876627 /DNA_START=297 /DNA_END=1514 /DNA_ORIENTATION=+